MCEESYWDFDESINPVEVVYYLCNIVIFSLQI